MINEQLKECKKCKEKINKSAKKCPHCGSKQGIPKWLIVILVIIAFGIIFSGNSDNETENEQNLNNNASANEENQNSNSQNNVTIEYIKVTKDELDEALENNAAAAKDKYNKKYVEVSGKLGTIDSDLSYITLMSSSNEWDFNGIHCKIKNSNQKDIVKTLTKDQEITIRGKITDVGEVLGYYLDITEIITQ